MYITEAIGYSNMYRMIIGSKLRESPINIFSICTKIRLQLKYMRQHDIIFLLISSLGQPQREALRRLLRLSVSGPTARDTAWPRRGCGGGWCLRRTRPPGESPALCSAPRAHPLTVRESPAACMQRRIETPSKGGEE